MASCKVIRRLALLHHARGFCYKQDVVPQPRSSMQLLAALEEHVGSSGKELLAGLKDVLCWEKKMWREKEEIQREKWREKEEMWREKEEMWREKQEIQLEKWREKEEIQSKLQVLREQMSTDLVNLLSSKGLNDIRGLFERMEEVLAACASNPAKKGSHLWEAILNADRTLHRCIEKVTKISATDVVKQAADCHTIYDVLLQHIHAGKELAQLQAVNGKILFHRGPMSPEQVQIFKCIGQAVKFDIEEDPSTRPC